MPPVRGQSGTITAVVNALAKAGIELGENGSVTPRPKKLLTPNRLHVGRYLAE